MGWIGGFFSGGGGGGRSGGGRQLCTGVINQLMFVVARVESHFEGAGQALSPQTAGVQVVVFRLEALGFSQNCFNLVVDHVGDLSLSGGDRDQPEQLLGLGLAVVFLHSIASSGLHLVRVWTPLKPAAQQRDVLGGDDVLLHRLVAHTQLDDRETHQH